MLEGLRTAAAGMQAQQQKLDAVSNDLANANTNGYKRLRVGFSDLLYEQGGRPTTSDDAQLGTGSRAVSVGRTFQQGSLRETANPLDVALEGEGFIKVKLADGRQGLTRDGGLHLDGNRRLVTSFGGFVQPQITIPDGVADSQISIGRDGTVLAAGQSIGKIGIATVRSPHEPAGRRQQRLRHHGPLGQRRRRARGHRAQAGRARGLQHRHLAVDDRDDRGPAHLPADVAGDPDRRPDDGDRQRGQAMSLSPISDASLPADIRSGGTAGHQGLQDRAPVRAAARR